MGTIEEHNIILKIFLKKSWAKHSSYWLLLYSVNKIKPVYGVTKGWSFKRNTELIEGNVAHKINISSPTFALDDLEDVMNRFDNEGRGYKISSVEYNEEHIPEDDKLLFNNSLEQVIKNHSGEDFDDVVKASSLDKFFSKNVNKERSVKSAINTSKKKATFKDLQHERKKKSSW